MECSYSHQDGVIHHPIGPFGDRVRTEMRHKEAINELKQSLHSASNSQFPQLLNFEEFRENNQIPFLRVKIDEILQARNSSGKNRNFMHRIFVAMAPISKSLLGVVTQSQPVT